jgi:hypothetical protein
LIQIHEITKINKNLEIINKSIISTGNKYYGSFQLQGCPGDLESDFAEKYLRLIAPFILQ